MVLSRSFGLSFICSVCSLSQCGQIGERPVDAGFMRGVHAMSTGSRQSGKPLIRDPLKIHHAFS